MLSVDDLVNQFSDPEMQDKMVKLVSEKVRNRLEEAMPRLIPQNLARVLLIWLKVSWCERPEPGALRLNSPVNI